MRANEAGPREGKGDREGTMGTRQMGHQVHRGDLRQDSLNVSSARRQSQRKRESEREGDQKTRERNAGPLAPSSPWLQSLKVGEGIMTPRPQDCSVDHDRATSRRLVPSTPARVPRPRRLPSSLSPSVAVLGATLSVPQMPAAIFALAFPFAPLPVSFPTATAQGAENVAKLQLGKFRSASRTNGVWGVLNNHEPTGTAQSLRQGFDHSRVVSCPVCPSTPCVRAVECYF